MSEQQHNLIHDPDGDLKYDISLNRLGRFTSIIALALMIMVPLVITIAHNVAVDVTTLVAVLGTLLAMFIPMAVIENIAHYAIVGAGGVYLNSITGNVMNMKIPAAISGMKIAKVEPGSREGDIISILAIGTSSLVTVVIVFLGMLFIGQVLAPYLSHSVLEPGFANVMPALIGALLVPIVLKNPKIAAVPLLASISIGFIMGSAWLASNQHWVMPFVLGGSVCATYIMYKQGMLTPKSKLKGEENG